jgi:hypothetical protein
MKERTKPAKFRWVWLAALSFQAAAGCARTASFVHCKPAQANIERVRRLAVLDVEGTRHMGPAATQALLDQLREGQIFELVGQAELERYAAAPILHQDGSHNLDVALDAANRLGIDAVLVSRLRFQESNGVSYGSVTFRIGDPEVAAVIRYELWDASSGTLLDRNQIASEVYDGELSQSAHGPSSEAKVLERLARQCAASAARELVPHESTVEVSLASAVWGPAAGEIREGNGFAQDGDWAQARRHWQTALERDPSNTAALYNLGLACEANREYERAVGYYEAALAQEDREVVRKSLERAQVAAAETHAFVAQRSPLRHAQNLAPPARALGPSGGQLTAGEVRPPIATSHWPALDRPARQTEP